MQRPHPAPATSEPDFSIDLRLLPQSQPLGMAGLLGARTWQVWLKRAIDLSVAVLALAVLSPMLLTAALAIKLSSPGPVFFIQRRVGRGGRPFPMLKFRSMRVDASSIRIDLTSLNESSGPVFKIRRDPRVTAVGRILRRLSIDELPQLFNVLAGQMSLVGPRPPIPEEVEQYRPWELQRLAVKPGLTCLWQVMGRADLDFETWVRLDLHYIESWSLRLDCKLLALTLPAVLSGRGAY